MEKLATTSKSNTIIAENQTTKGRDQYCINIEGKEFTWSKGTTTEEIIELGVGCVSRVIEIDNINGTLHPGEIIHINRTWIFKGPLEEIKMQTHRAN